MELLDGPGVAWYVGGLGASMVRGLAEGRYAEVS